MNGRELELAEGAAAGSLAEQAGWPVARIADAVCVVAAAARDNTMLNRVTGLGLGGDVADADLVEIEAFFREAGTRYAVAVSPHADPTLAARLRERGFVDGYSWMKFGRGAAPPPAVETPLHVRRVDDGSSYASVLAAGFGISVSAEDFERLPAQPGWQCFLAFDGGAPVATGALYAHDGIAWLGLAATLPERRRLGAQNALLAARIAAAIESGCRLLTTETGERLPDRPNNSYRNIVRAGFEEQYVRPNLVSPA